MWHAPAAIIIQALSQVAVAIVGGNDFDRDKCGTRSVASLRPTIPIDREIDDTKQVGLDANAELRHQDQPHPLSQGREKNPEQNLNLSVDWRWQGSFHNLPV